MDLPTGDGCMDGFANELLELRTRIAEGREAPTTDPVLQEFLLGQLETATEELRVADEEVRAQRDEINRLVLGQQIGMWAQDRLIAVLPVPVFVTDAGRVETFWAVVERGERSVRYSRVAPAVSAGTVEVRLRGDAGGTVAEVAYDLTALSDEGDAALAKLESGYDEFLGEWRDAIAAAVSSGHVP